MLLHRGLQDFKPARFDELFLLGGELLLSDKRGELLQVIDHPDILLERDGMIFLLRLHPDLQVEQLLADAGKVFGIDPLTVLAGEAVEGHLCHRVLRYALLCHPGDDLLSDIARMHPQAFDRPEIDHRGLREVKVLYLTSARIDKQSAFLIRDLAVREVLGRSRVPRVVRDLRLPVVVAERDVIEPVGEDRAVQLVLRNGREPLVLDRRREPVGHQHVVVTRSQFDLVVRYPVILDPQHVGDQMKHRVANLHLLVPEFVRRRDPGGVVVEDRVGRGRVPGLDHAVVPGDHHERDPGRVEPFERFEHRCVCLRLRLYRIEEVAGMDEDIRFFFDDRIHCRKEIVVHLLLAQVHPALRVKPVERGEAQVGVGDVDEGHFLNV